MDSLQPARVAFGATTAVSLASSSRLAKMAAKVLPDPVLCNKAVLFFHTISFMETLQVDSQA